MGREKEGGNGSGSGREYFTILSGYFLNRGSEGEEPYRPPLRVWILGFEFKWVYKILVVYQPSLRDLSCVRVSTQAHVIILSFCHFKYFLFIILTVPTNQKKKKPSKN